MRRAVLAASIIALSAALAGAQTSTVHAGGSAEVTKAADAPEVTRSAKFRADKSGQITKPEDEKYQDVQVSTIHVHFSGEEDEIAKLLAPPNDEYDYLWADDYTYI